MKRIIILFFFSITSVFSQEKVYFYDEITIKNFLFYSKEDRSLVTGTVYNEVPDVQNECECTFKISVLKGKRHGSEMKWHMNGKKSFEAKYINGVPIGEHVTYNEDGTIRSKDIFASTGGKVKTQVYYHHSGNESRKTYLKNNGNSVEERYFDTSDKRIQSHKEFKNNKPIGKAYELNKSGDTLSYALYGNDNILHKRTFKEGKVSSQTKWIEDIKLAHTKVLFPLNGNVTQEYFETSEGLKDSVHLWYLADGSRYLEKSYKRGNLVYEGGYSASKKNGKWLHYPSLTTIKVIDYDGGVEIQSKLYERKNNIKKILSEGNDSSHYRYSSENGETQNVIIQILNSDIENARIRQIVSNFVVQLRKRMERVQTPQQHDFLDKKIVINNIKFQLNEFEFQKKKFVYGEGIVLVPTTGYECYITMSIEIEDSNGKKLYSKKHEFNKSNNVLNILGNAIASSYSTTPQKAFGSALKDMKLDKIFSAYFPISSDKKNKKRKRS